MHHNDVMSTTAHYFQFLFNCSSFLDLKESLKQVPLGSGSTAAGQTPVLSANQQSLSIQANSKTWCRSGTFSNWTPLDSPRRQPTMHRTESPTCQLTRVDRFSMMMRYWVLRGGSGLLHHIWTLFVITTISLLQCTRTARINSTTSVNHRRSPYYQCYFHFCLFNLCFLFLYVFFSTVQWLKMKTSVSEFWPFWHQISSVKALKGTQSTASNQRKLPSRLGCCAIHAGSPMPVPTHTHSQSWTNLRQVPKWLTKWLLDNGVKTLKTTMVHQYKCRKKQGNTKEMLRFLSNYGTTYR